VNWNDVYLSLDGTTSNMPVLGTDSPGSAGCASPRNLWYQGSLVASGAPTHTCFDYTAQVVTIADDPRYTLHRIHAAGILEHPAVLPADTALALRRELP
jgi:hypothetical protein